MSETMTAGRQPSTRAVAESLHIGLQKQTKHLTGKDMCFGNLQD